MLKYLVSVTEDLIVAGLIYGMLMSYIKFNHSRKSRLIVLGGVAVSLIAAVVQAVMIQTTNKVNIGYTNLTMFGLYILGFLLFAVFDLRFLRKRTGMVGEMIETAGGVLMLFALAFYSLPDVLLYPFNFNLAGNTVFSTDFIYRFIGCILAAVLVLVAGIAAYKIEKGLSSPENKTFMVLAMLVNALSFAGKSIQIMRTRMMIPSSTLTFNIIKITLNYSEYFIFATALCVLLAAFWLYGKNRVVTEEYANSAQLRKIKARMRNKRRWATVLLVCTLLVGVNLTAIDAYNNKAPDEAPVEEGELTDDAIIVPFSMVEDGNLHRFGWTTDDGILVKFIVVRKPGGATYGVGLDACDICGDAGYFQRGDQIVCKRCDVVMNTNTIGFKGGCNPIVIDYRVEDGKIIVPLETLIEHAKEFK